MIKQLKPHLAITIILIFIYIIVINSLNFFSSFSLFSQEYIIRKQIVTGSTVENTNLGDSLSLSVSRRRWYGRIYERINNNGKISNLYLLGFIKLPLTNKNMSYAIYHILFFIVMLIYISTITTVKLINYRKHKYYYI